MHLWAIRAPLSRITRWFIDILVAFEPSSGLRQSSLKELKTAPLFSRAVDCSYCYLSKCWISGRGQVMESFICLAFFTFCFCVQIDERGVVWRVLQRKSCPLDPQKMHDLSTDWVRSTLQTIPKVFHCWLSLYHLYLTSSMSWNNLRRLVAPGAYLHNQLGSNSDFPWLLFYNVKLILVKSFYRIFS